ncbi:hypothetical protein ALC57_02040 [Trachymyrmex cornetzi]|uniref:DUF4817 domain-containing protein n=1 Tax=Trachymyrmex cornetzi TaxID=471704 RepID=A0A151JPL1_9HYME|nr:hypothetical protein ALC57_02040 [Trachymyrmex cornetzi]
MNHYQPSEIVDMLLVLGECHTNYREAARVYRDRYPDGRIVNHTTIRRLALRARQGLLRRDGGNHQYDENDNRVVTILGLIHLDPHVSSRTLAQVTGIPRTTILRILKNVKYRPYHITLTQALTPNDIRLRIGFCEWAQARLVDDPRFFEYVMFSDEACFQSSGHLNRHNSHYWSDVNPHWYRGIDNQHRWSVNEYRLSKTVEESQKSSTPHVRGKGTHKNQAPRREQRTTTSTSLFLGSAKSSSSMTLMIHNSDLSGRIVDHNQCFVKGLKPAFSSHGEKLGVPFKKTIVTPE